jgi:hypothetical protein
MYSINGPRMFAQTVPKPFCKTGRKKKSEVIQRTSLSKSLWLPDELVIVKGVGISNAFDVSSISQGFQFLDDTESLSACADRR